MHGLGVYTWKIGDKYIGEVQYGRIHGFGTYTWRTNSKYVGQWKEGKMHGNGVKTDPHGVLATPACARLLFNVLSHDCGVG